MRRSAALAAVAALAVAGAAACGAASAAEPRWFRMGFTPQAYDISDASILDVYARINARQDVIAHHLDRGVPWPEAYEDRPTYDPNVEAEIARRLANTPAGMPVYLALAPFNPGRNAPADYWGSSDNMPRPGEWAGKPLDDPMMVQAYLNYARNLVRRFRPLYLNYGIECTESVLNDPSLWPHFMAFARQVYPRLKAEFPGLAVFVSVTLRDEGTPDWATVVPKITEAMTVSDYMAVSTYRYLFGTGDGKGNPANLPPRWLQQAADLAPDKPFAIAETGWLAETLDVPAWGLHVPGTAAWQADYVRALLDEADRLHARFVTWFLIVDYDRLWFWINLFGNGDPAWLLWKDTGLYDGNAVARPALAVWDQRFADGHRAVPPVVPDGFTVPGAPLQVRRAEGGDVEVTWSVAACAAPSYHLAWFDLRAFPSYAPAGRTCDAGATGSWTGAPPPGDVGVIAAAGDGGSVEGSHGVDAAGFERPSRATECGFTIKATDAICP